MRTDMFFKVNLEVADPNGADDLGKDLAVFLEEYLNGEDCVDVRYIGHL